MPHYNPPPKHDPSPEEIREACLRIQSTWSDAERALRAGVVASRDEYRYRHWLPPVVSDALVDAVTV